MSPPARETAASAPHSRLSRLPRSALVRVRYSLRRAAHPLRIEYDRARTRRGRADLAIFHDFTPAPTGGGSQFLRAVIGEFERRGLAVEINQLSGRTPACLFNSFNFDFARLRRFSREDCVMVHRVDGPIGVYRGYDDGTDTRILDINHELADRTILQSRYSLDKHRELGLDLRNPTVIPNATDPSVFYPPPHRQPLLGRKVKLIAVSWSDNPRKGFPTLEWLDGHLDFDRYDLTFVGRSPVAFEYIHRVPAIPSDPLAALLREHDLYLAPSLDDPCSNSLIEALSCGLPALYAQSGGHPDIVGDAGLPYSSPAEIPTTLERLADELEDRRARITVPSLATVADNYLQALELETPTRPTR